MTIKKISWTLADYKGQPVGTVVAKTRVTVARVDGAAVAPFQELAPTITSVDYDFAPDVAYLIKVESIDPAGNLVPGVAAKPMAYTLATVTVQGPGTISVS